MSHEKFLNMTPEERIAYREKQIQEYYENRKPFLVGDHDIEYPMVRNPELHKWLENRFIELGAIPKDKLENGKWYHGACRNADKALWNGMVFEYDRHKFGMVFKDYVNHFQDDNGYDVFVPIKEI